MRKWMRKELSAALGCLFAAALLWGLQIHLEQKELADRIAPKLLRFHVMADSNNKEDQEIKLQVRSFLIDRIYEEMENSQKVGIAWDKASLVRYLSSSRRQLEEETHQFLKTLGKDQTVSLNVVWQKFPEKYYGNLRLPAGRYEAAQVKIGSGRGRNWWCILYPSICITKDAAAAVPESSLETLQSMLSREDYQKLLTERPAVHLDFQLRRLTANWPALLSHLSPNNN